MNEIKDGIVKGLHDLVSSLGNILHWILTILLIGAVLILGLFFWQLNESYNNNIEINNKNWKILDRDTAQISELQEKVNELVNKSNDQGITINQMLTVLKLLGY